MMASRIPDRSSDDGWPPPPPPLPTDDTAMEAVLANTPAPHSPSAGRQPVPDVDEFSRYDDMPSPRADGFEALDQMMPNAGDEFADVTPTRQATAARRPGRSQRRAFPAVSLPSDDVAQWAAVAVCAVAVGWGSWVAYRHIGVHQVWLPVVLTLVVVATGVLRPGRPLLMVAGACLAAAVSVAAWWGLGVSVTIATVAWLVSTTMRGGAGD